jgi:hypothetical protein
MAEDSKKRFDQFLQAMVTQRVPWGKACKQSAAVRELDRVVKAG